MPLHHYGPGVSLGAWVDGAFLFLQRFAERQVDEAGLSTFEVDITVLVSPTPQDAARAVDARDQAAEERQGRIVRRRGNVVVYADTDRASVVEAALDGLG